MKKLIVLFLIAALSSQISVAKDAWDRTFDSIYVNQKIYYSLDKELNRVYKTLKIKLSKKGRRVLASSEKDWVSRRDHMCAYPSTNSVDIDCAVRETRNRLHFLQDRVRECEELGCKISRLY